MSLPASNRKAPSRAVIAATLLALGATSAVAQNAQPNYGFAQQQQFAAPYGYAQQQAPFGAPAGFPGYAIQPASTFNQQPAAQGFAAPAPQQPSYAAPAAPQQPAYAAPQQAPQGYGTAPQPFPGYGVPGGFPVPGAVGAPIAGFNPYGDPYGASSQWSQFAPSEPTYAPAERAPAAVAAAPAPAAPATMQPIESATVATTVAPDYTYEVAPATGSTYVGSSAEFTTGVDPYQAIPAQPAPAYTQQYQAAPQQPQQPQQPAYTQQPQQPAYTQQYEVAPQQPQQQYEATASYPAPQESVNVGGYEYQAAPQQPSTDYYDLSAQTAAAAAAALATAAPQQQVVVAQPTYAAPVAPRGAHFVQVGAFVDPGRANNLVNQLGSKGEQAIIIPAQVRGKLYHRVRVIAASQRDARVVRDRIRNLGYYEARVVKG